MHFEKNSFPVISVGNTTDFFDTPWGLWVVPDIVAAEMVILTFSRLVGVEGGGGEVDEEEGGGGAVAPTFSLW